MQFVLLSDVNATDFVAHTSVPIFRDPSAGRQAWRETTPHGGKHDTCVYAPSGVRTLFWDPRTRDFARWPEEIRGAVEALGK